MSVEKLWIKQQRKAIKFAFGLTFLLRESFAKEKIVQELAKEISAPTRILILHDMQCALTRQSADLRLFLSTRLLIFLQTLQASISCACTQ